MSRSQVSLHESVLIRPSTSDAEAALSVLLSCLGDKIKDACMRPESVAMRLFVEESDLSVNLLESSLRVFTAAVRNRVAVFQTRHNDLMPFNSLPTELVAGVLLASIPSNGDKGYSETDAVGITKLQQLASVCRRWRDIVKTCPQLWTVLGTREPSVVALKLKRSGSLPLTIKISSPPSLTLLKNFLSVITKHCHRWSSADISYDDVLVEEVDREAIEAISNTLGLPMPIPQYLKLVQHASETGSLIDLSRLINALLLRHLSLSSVSPLGLPAPICSTLRTLHISNLHYTENATNMLMKILGMCTQLKSLEFCQNFWPSPDDIQMPRHLPTIHLPDLERLECSYNYERISLPLLSTIRAEKLRWLRIHDNGADGKAIFREILRSQGGPSLLSTVLANLGRTSLSMTVDYNLELQTKLPHIKELDILLGDGSPWEKDVVHLLKEHPLPSNTPPIDLKIYDSSYITGEAVSSVVHILEITQSISQTSTLSLYCVLSTVRTFFTALVEANETDFERQLPNIAHIVLPLFSNEHGWEELIPIFRALEARYISSGVPNIRELPFKIRDGAERRLNLGTGEWVAEQ